MRSVVAKGKARANKEKRRTRIRLSVVGTAQKPRLTVFRSNRHLVAQVIDDSTGCTLASASSLSILKETGRKNVNKELAKKVGEDVAKAALSKGVKTLVFDRAGYLYHGLVKELADGARAAGLQF